MGRPGKRRARGKLSERNFTETRNVASGQHPRVCLEAALVKIEKQLEIESQHGPIRVIMKDGKPINIEKGEK